MEINEKIFRAGSVRGVYGRDLDEEVAERMGKAFGTFVGFGKKVVVGRDARNSGTVLKRGVIAGLVSVGCDVVDIGTVTTPMFNFTIAHKGFDAGICVTASHNPAEWNGFKLAREHGMLCGEGTGMEQIKQLFIENKFNSHTDEGTVEELDVYPEYKEFVLSKVKPKKRLNIVIDPGNGVGGYFVEDLFKSAGHSVFVINGKPDGSFPSRPSDPVEENVSELKREVVSRGADMGIAFDGDADRIALIDDKGRYVPSGNITIPLISEHYLQKHKGAKIVFDVCCSSGVEELVSKMGGKPVISRIGQAFIVNRMSDEGAVFGGEYSNHLNFSDMYFFDDAVFGGLKISEIVSSKGKNFSQLVDEIPRYPASKVLEIPCNDDTKFAIVSAIAEKLKKDYRLIDIDGIKAYDKDNNWMLIRASNTLPVIKINSEGKTEEKMRFLFELAKKTVEEGIKQYENPDH